MFGFKNRNEDNNENGKKVKLEGCLVEQEDKLCRHKQYKDSCYFCLTGKEPKTEGESSSSVFGEMNSKTHDL